MLFASVGGVFEMCICLAAGGVGGVGGECIRVFDLGLVLGWVGLREVGGVYDVCVCFG